MAATDMRANARHRSRGFSMIEVLVSLLIIQVGLLGLVGTQVLAQRGEAEAYQRAQAVILLNDMVERLNVNRNYGACLAFTSISAGTPYVGVNDSGHFTTTNACSGGNDAAAVNASLGVWDRELQGAAERQGSTTGTKVGALLNARGCITSVSTTAAAGGPSGGSTITTYYLGVAWQGLTDSFSPLGFSSNNANAANIQNCGTGLYGPETQRRLVWTSVQIANLN